MTKPPAKRAFIGLVRDHKTRVGKIRGGKVGGKGESTLTKGRENC